jgi:integrase
MLRLAHDRIDPLAPEKAARKADITVSEYARQWLAVIETELKPSTVESYKWLFNKYIKPTFGNMRLGDVDRAQVKALLAEKRQQGLNKNTVRLARSCLSALLAQAVDEERIVTNPTVEAKRGQKSPGSMSTSERLAAVRPFSEAELSAVLDAARGYEYSTLFLTLARTGMRPGEAFALRWDDLDFREARDTG